MTPAPDPTPILVLSYTHLLLPLANRLATEGHEVTTQVRVPEFASAWVGSGLERIPPDADLAPWVARAEAGELLVVSDSLETRTVLGNIPPDRKWEMLPTERRPASWLRLGVWFDGSEPRMVHWLFTEQGFGGGVPAIDTGLTLVWETGRNLGRLDPLLATLTEEWKRVGFRGLAQVGLQIDASGALEAVGAYLGWPPLHTAVFLAAFDGQVPFDPRVAGMPLYRDQYTLGAVLSVAPWPWLKRPRGALAAAKPPLAIPEELAGEFWWWGVEIDQEAGQLRGAGLDGLLGVARARGYCLGAAQARLQSLVNQLAVPELQARPGIGVGVPLAQASLESVGWIVTPG